MALYFSHIILFGIVSIINGKQVEENIIHVKNQHELRKILQELEDLGKYDISITHYEGTNSDAEDIDSKAAPYEKPRKHYYRKKYHYVRETVPDKNFGSEYGKSIQYMNEVFKKKYDFPDSDNNVIDKIFESVMMFNKPRKSNVEIESDDAQEILDFLEDEQSNSGDDYDTYVSKLRCTGKTCGRNKKGRINDDRYKADSDRKDLRCKGKNCARNRNGREKHINNRNEQKGKKSNVEAVVIDLTRMENGDDLAKQIGRLLTLPRKGSHKDSNNLYADYDDYGTVRDLKNENFNLEKQNNTDRQNSRIVGHSQANNNVYVPQWLLDKVLKGNLRYKNRYLETKSLFPLTRQQRERRANRSGFMKPVRQRIFRRNSKQEVGVPFHLEVQGLGQVSP